MSGPASGRTGPGGAPAGDRLVSVAIDGWLPLPNAIEVSFGPEQTIFASRDGQSASLVCAGIAQGARAAVLGMPDLDPPRYFRCEIVTSAGQRLSYAYDRRFQDDDEPLAASIRWVARPGGTHPGGPSLGLVHSDRHVPDDARRIHALLSGVRWLSKTLPRPEAALRKPLRLTGRSGVLWNPRGVDYRLGNLAATLVLWFETQPDRYRELVDIARRIGALTDIAVHIVQDTDPHPEFVEPRHHASLSVDGTDYGLLPDGTLRVLEIVTALLNPEVTLLILEEPEVALEPTLRDRLLEEIAKGAGSRQVVLSTQAPEVMASARSDELRLVERGSRTTVRAVRLEEARRALGG